MPTPDFSLPGTPCWIDLNSSDPAKSADFYGQLLGWTATDMGEEFGHYFIFSKNGQAIGGMMQNNPETGAPDAWTTYLSTPDAKEAAEAAAAQGAQMFMPPMQVADQGTMILLADPAGAMLGGWQPDQRPGFDVMGEAGAPCWHELYTRDYGAAVKFYQDVFKWESHVMSDSEDFRYTTLGQGDDARAGIMDAAAFLPEGVPSHWVVYFGVQDVDASLEQVAALGGQIVRPAEDSPYGRLADVLDSTGAPFKLISVAAQ